jgi:pimeloyl-ACP methyl ester carboxylesterase
MKTRRATLLILFTVLAVQAPGISQTFDQLIDIDSTSLQIHVEGEGTPAVVIETGLADEMGKLRPLQHRLAQVTRVITYDRAGYGQSDPGPLPRNSGREVEELKRLLEKASVPGPYVLVGHSLGALNMQVFASRYPDIVAGVILMDPPPLSFIQGKEFSGLREMAEGMTAEWQAMADSGAQSVDHGERKQYDFFRMIASEHREMFSESARLAAAVTTFGDLPLIVMASGKPNPAFGEVAGRFQQYWVEQSRALSTKSTRGKFLLVEGASHHVYLDKPDLVAESVTSLVQEVRSR